MTPSVPPKKSGSSSSYRWLLGYARSVQAWMALAVGCGLLSAVLLIFQAHLLATGVHMVFIDGASRTLLVPMLAALVGASVLRGLLAWAREAAGFQAGARIRARVRMGVLRTIVDLGPVYTASRRSGALVSTALEQVEALHGFYAYYLPQLVLAAAIPATILAFVFPISWAAGAMLLVAAPLIPIFMVLVGMGAESVSQQHFQALARLSGHFLDTLRGLGTLKLFDRSRTEADNIARVSDDYRQRTMKVLRIAFLSSAVLEFFSALSIALVAVYLGVRYLGYVEFGAYGQPLTLAQGLFILILAPEFFLPLRELGTHYHARAEAVGAAEEIQKILTDTPLENRKDAELSVGGPPFEIAFENIWLSYDNGRRPVLRGLDFKLSPGRKTVLVGSSGAGKSTTVELLLGFLSPDRGAVSVNGQHLDQLDGDDWRRQVGWIGQRPVIFQGTIADNIRLGRRGAGDDDILQAAQFARVMEFARQLPQGLDTIVGEEGFGLSRGQAQRVALARVFLKDAPVLLLDEPAAGLDSTTEALILDALELLGESRTVLMLTHRLEHVADAGQILVLDEGKIVEQGCYADLMQAKARFYRWVAGGQVENHG